MENPKINTPKGIGEIENIYVSDLGFLMIRVGYEDGTYTTYNFGVHNINKNIFTNDILPSSKERWVS